MRVEDNAVFRVKDVAELLDVSPSTVYRAIEAGDLEAMKVGGSRKGAVRIPGHCVNTWINTCFERGYAAYVEGGESPEDGDDVSDTDQGSTETAEVA